MGAFLDKPKVEKQNENAKNNDINYASSSMQGWRVDMEDSHTAVMAIPELPKWSFFAVFDGHAGFKVAEYSSEHLLGVILKQEAFKQLITGATVENDDVIAKAIKDAFFELDLSMRQNADAENGLDRSGSTSVCVLISPTQFYFINCGDSRGLLCKNGKVAFATADHKPCNPLERDRIQKAGGSVMLQRVNGSLAVSRALGDYEYKSIEDRGPSEQLVSPEPDVTPISRNTIEDQFIILACDGIFDVSTDDELCSYVNSRLALSSDLVSVCNDVVDLSLHKGSRDNMTFMLLGLSAIPKPSAEALQRESKLEDQLRALVTEICKEDKHFKRNEGDFTIMFDTLLGRSEKIEGIPPGGGLYAKRAFIEGVFNEVCPEDFSPNINSAEGDARQESPDITESRESGL